MSDSSTPRFACICKKEFYFISLDSDELPISNLGALRMALEALNKEDAGDFERAEQMWSKAKLLLAEESEDDTGAGATGTVMVNDDLDMSGVGGLMPDYLP